MKKRGQRQSRKRSGTSVPVKVRGSAKAMRRRANRTSGKVSPAAQKALPIVGIGASAGGLEAFAELLRALPADTGMAFVLVQHLEPSHQSILSDLLAKTTVMPVQEVSDGIRAEANHVYVIPANADLSLIDGLFHVVRRTAPSGRHRPIDCFFRSLAETRKSQAIGVILSGAAPDGTAGLRAIKVEGGITLAQEPASAKFDGMPRSAIASGCVDLVLPPERIAAELARIGRHPFVAQLPPEGVAVLPMKVRAPVEMMRAMYERLASHGRPGFEASTRLDFAKEADRIVWERYDHAGIVVNNDLQILHFRGDTSPYLRPAPGQATFNLSKMLREELQLELALAIREARRSGRSVRTEAIRIKHDENMRAFNIEVRPLSASGKTEKCFLILFEKAGFRADQPSRPSTGKRKDKAVSSRKPGTMRDEEALLREYLQAVIRERESINEELMTAKTEALYSMEELQSTNEELLTAKEELQSSNEELTTLNEQLQNRNIELSHLSDDLNNVISGADIPIVILDSDSHIRSFTPPAQELLGVLPGDIGRPIENLHIGINVPDLKDLISAVIEKGGEVGREVQSEAGRWYWLRLRPFRTGEQKIEGVVMAFADIHAPKQNQEALQKEGDVISAVLNAAKDLLVVVMDREGRIVQFNRVCEQLTGYSAQEAKGRPPWFLLPPEETPAVKEIFKKLVGGTPNQKENHWITKDGRRLLISWSNSVVMSEGSVEFVVATGVDQTERGEARQKAQESEAIVHALLDTAAQAILTINRQGQIVLANAAAESMFGYSREELIGQPVEKLIPQRFREGHATHLAMWFAQPISRAMGVGLELSGLHKDSSEFPVNISLSYIESGGEVLGVAFVSDITERKKNEEALLDYQRRLQSLTRNLLSAQDTENRELARELHDVFSQELAALGMEVSSLLSSSEIASPLTLRLANLGKKIGDLADDMHRTSRQLHPAILHELGLETALREECSTFSQQSGIAVQFLSEEMPALLPEDVSLCLYRVAQESLRNIRKHTGATGVCVQLRGEGEGISLRVEDTGDGFDVAEARKSGGLGLISMEERVRSVNGRFAIRSTPGNGTTVEVFVPLDDKAK